MFEFVQRRGMLLAFFICMSVTLAYSQASHYKLLIIIFGKT